MGIIKIVLTGGPAAGKTTILEALKEYYSKYYNVICIPETARELIGSGIIPTDENIIGFQELVLKLQSTKEEKIENFAQNHNKNTIIFYDRGVLDNKAYLNTQDEFDSLLKKNNLSEIYFADKYDLIIDLVSTAKLGEEFYETDNERKEHISYAKELDRKTTNAWLLSPMIKKIEPTIDQKDKEKEVIKTIDAYLDSRLIISENERPIDINKSNLSMYNDENSKKISVFDSYIDIDNPYTDYILRRRCYKNVYSYSFVIERTINNVKRLLHRAVMDEKEFYNSYRHFNMKHVVNREEIRTLNDNGDILTISLSNDSNTISCDKSEYAVPGNIKLDIKQKRL